MDLRGMIWWTDRWTQSRAFLEMTLEEQGGYRNLLDRCWRNGGGLSDDILAKACGDAQAWPRIKKRVMKEFRRGPDGLWHNETLDEVLQVSQRRAEKQAAYRQRVNGHKR